MTQRCSNMITRKMLHSSSLKALFVGCLVGCTLSCGSETGPAGLSAEPGEWLPGGAGTNTLLFGANALGMPAANISEEHRQRFFVGNSFFRDAWVQAPASTESRDGLGPLFNARSCGECHFKDGRGRPPLTPDEPFVGILLRLSVDGAGPHGEPLPEATYGDQLQPYAIADVPAEGRPTVVYTDRAGTYDDGTSFVLLRPKYAIEEPGYGPMAEGLLISPRVAPAMAGVGLLEAIAESDIEALADPDDRDNDGISGRVNVVWDVERQTQTIGRFGWKAEQPSVRQQSAGAFVGDMGISSPLFPAQACSDPQTACAGAPTGGTPEIADHFFDDVVLYAQLLAVPARLNADDPLVLRGKVLFEQAECNACHVPQQRTVANAEPPELADQDIWPYTDLLLHDMGEDLADGRPTFAASGREWRTPPLWGLRFYPEVNGHDRLLHDGRARGVAEAILWHGGEAQVSQDIFRSLASDDRDALVAFVESL